MDKSSLERTSGPLSRTAAWRAGCYWEKKGDAKVFLEKCGQKKEMSVEKLIGQDGPRFWFGDKTPEPPEQQAEERLEDQSVTEEDAGESTTEDATQAMSEADPDEKERGKKMWLSEKVTTLEKENEDLKKMLRELGQRLNSKERRSRKWPSSTARWKRQSRRFGNKSNARTLSTKA